MPTDWSDLHELDPEIDPSPRSIDRASNNDKLVVAIAAFDGCVARLARHDIDECRRRPPGPTHRQPQPARSTRHLTEEQGTPTACVAPDSDAAGLALGISVSCWATRLSSQAQQSLGGGACSWFSKPRVRRWLKAPTSRWFVMPLPPNWLNSPFRIGGCGAYRASVSAPGRCVPA